MGKALKLLIIVLAVAALAAGCAREDTPSETVLKFFDSLQKNDKEGLGRVLSFDRLMAEQKSEEYLSLPPERRQEELARFRENLVAGLLSGKSSKITGVDPKVRNERISGDLAEVVVYNRKIKDQTFSFGLAREEGIWKIYRISG